MKHKMITTTLLTILAAVVITAGPAVDALAGANILIINLDGPGEGFNDNTPWTPTGGNPATTLGQARLNAFQHAADIWGQCINSNVTIRVEARMDPQFCDPTSAVLGSAGAKTVHRDFAGAPAPLTWYPQALANSLAGVDLTTTADIGATFNSNLNGDAGCLGGIGWYYGYDSSPGSDIDFVTVVLHEVGHGLGFQTFVNLQLGTKLNGFNDTYMLNLGQVGASPFGYPAMSNTQRVAASISDPNLVWTGSSVTAEHPNIPVTSGLNSGWMRAHGPNPAQGGSSVSHWSSTVSPNEVMEPAYTGAEHDPSLALQLMEDIGWSLDPNCVCTASPATVVNNSQSNLGAPWPFWSFNVELENTGANNAISVSAVMSGGPAWLTIVDPNCAYGNIAAGTTDLGTPDFYRVNLTGWPGGSFVVVLDVTWEDDCGNVQSDQYQQTLDPTSFIPVGSGAPARYNDLAQNVPNPFNPTTQLGYQIAADVHVTLAVYDVAGRLVRTLVDKQQSAGGYTETWDGYDNKGRLVSSGVYFYRLTAGDFVQTRRMVMLK